ncbi:hypothetical protein OG864_51765 [Streptomyces sp. NBC_00124]|uniref:hypothetical protein n=1 Tax=Streptomyces sp. NBC_00124 TaxID=2975662 RepID=UPI00225BF091|nr:hypothetical protein [Streptomyces sp. NBC_00124]MCX5367159.1 hypothetical protein [Streptomyces sp. NBC_00124]
MAAYNTVPDILDPNVESAAEAGDPTSMRLLGNYVYRARHERSLAEQWLLAAAEAGDAEAMYDLSRFFWDQAVNKIPQSQTEEAASEAWCRRAAESGWRPAMESMAQRHPHEQEFWLRRAADDGSPASMLGLAHFLERRGQTAEAEHWYRTAVSNGLPHARRNLASLLAGQGRLAEALRYVRAEAEAAPIGSRAAGELADLFQRLGQTDEASVWRAQAEALRLDEGTQEHPAGTPPDLAAVVLTAVITTAVVPFVQALASKVAEDAYAQARQSVRRLLHREDLTSSSS